VIPAAVNNVLPSQGATHSKPELLIFTGMRFGLMQTKVGLVSLLSKYQLSVSKKTPIPVVFDPRTNILSPKGGMWLQIRKRIE